MRKHFLNVVSMLCLMTFNSNAGWFDSGEQKEKERREHAEQQLAQEQEKDNGMGFVIIFLAAGSVAALGIGAAVGSKTRRDAHEQ